MCFFNVFFSPTDVSAIISEMLDVFDCFSFTILCEHFWVCFLLCFPLLLLFFMCILCIEYIVSFCNYCTKKKCLKNQCLQQYLLQSLLVIISLSVSIIYFNMGSHNFSSGQPGLDLNEGHNDQVWIVFITRASSGCCQYWYGADAWMFGNTVVQTHSNTAWWQGNNIVVFVQSH